MLMKLWKNWTLPMRKVIIDQCNFVEVFEIIKPFKFLQEILLCEVCLTCGHPLTTLQLLLVMLDEVSASILTLWG